MRVLIEHALSLLPFKVCHPWHVVCYSGWAAQCYVHTVADTYCGMFPEEQEAHFSSVVHDLDKDSNTVNDNNNNSFYLLSICK